jgi:hypothetical protein
MRPDSDKYYCYQWCGRMQWACVCDATGRYCNWVLAHSLGWIVPGRAGSWEKYQQNHLGASALVIRLDTPTPIEAIQLIHPTFGIV